MTHSVLTPKATPPVASLQSTPQRSKLPHYEHPPLVEVVLGVRWSVDGPLDEQAASALLERLGPAWQRAPQRESTHSGLPQSWNRPAAVFQSVLGEQRLEVSSEGLEYAWDGRQGDIYPHYESVRDGFVVALDACIDGLASTGTAAPMLCGWKVAYLNCIPQGTVWTDLADCTFFRLLAPVPASLPHLDRCEGQWTFALDGYDALLACDLKTTAGTTRDPRTCLWLRLTCSGAPTDGDGAVLEGLDYGRETIVRTFRQLMSASANAYWELDRDV